MKSRVCVGCPKIYNDNGIERCWFDTCKIGFWNDLLMEFECDYYENYKELMKKKE